MQATSLTQGPISREYISGLLADTGSDRPSGAVALFIGRVRNDIADGREVTGIDYSAYEAMVGPVVEEIREGLFLRFPDLTGIHILHSTGFVASGEISLAVQVSSGHRKEAFAALESCVEAIKEKLPVWKKELFSDGSSRWIH